MLADWASSSCDWRVLSRCSVVIAPNERVRGSRASTRMRLGDRELGDPVGVGAVLLASGRREEVGPIRGLVGDRAPRVRHADRDDPVVARDEVDGRLGRGEHHLAVEDVERLLEGVQVRGHDATRFESADPEVAVHRAVVVTHAAPPGEPASNQGRPRRARGSRRLQLGERRIDQSSDAASPRPHVVLRCDCESRSRLSGPPTV